MKYLGTPPTECDLCHEPIKDKFVDGATEWGPWGNMCPACFRFNGCGLGTGRGQEYSKQPDGSWVKTAG